jgi:ankyrin repeat protein
MKKIVFIIILILFSTAIFSEIPLSKKEFDGLMHVLGYSHITWNDDGSGTVQKKELAGATSRQAVEIMMLGDYNRDEVTGEHFLAFIIRLIEKRSDYVLSLLDNLADINIKDNEGKTLLYYGLHSKYTIFIKELVKRGAELVLKPGDRYYSITEMVRPGDIELMEMLFERGMEVEPILLTRAVDSADIPMIDFLIKKGIDVNNIRYYNNESVLMHLLDGYNDSSVVFEFLIKNGADITARNSKRNNILSYIIRSDYVRTGYMDALFRSSNSKALKEICYDNLLNDLFRVAHDDIFRGQDLEWAKVKQYITEFIGLGADINHIDRNGYTPLFQAARAGWRDVMDLLLEKGAAIPTGKTKHA